ncbi:DUF4446 family protein [Paenibacillus abyssi]|uniref:DUF4446 domain-containing protein n=1 Tax=Paenibacillus abyssi TaxID=1340531 RepID=A0A917LIH1_9BACL|nr:DUF4446 family protein [Paenibacillus abyssi]GGG26835.1 hypothetical protein GCM10010916_49060 [Paenibacillus abyssi]
MEDILLDNLVGIVAAIGFILFILIVWLLMIGRRLSKMRKRYMQMMADTEVHNLEQVIVDLQHSHRQQEEQLALQTKELKIIAEALKKVKGNVGILRYNAFAEQGSDMSFSLAIVNEHQDGVIISGIHSREETYVYAKPLKQGESNYALSPEERKAITLALQQA